MDIDREVNTWRGHPVVARGLALLRERLPGTLQYHVAAHTEDVLREAVLLMRTDSLALEERELVVVAAAFHDTGFIDKAKENETLSADLATQAMEEHESFSPEEVKIVRDMILDTELKMTSRGLKQIATTKLAGYLCDADVGNLGRDDFFEKAELVRLENGVSDKSLFYSRVREFLLSHEWYSPAAKKLRDDKKAQNLLELERKLKEGDLG